MMTIPTRPAPAPPGQRGLNAVAGANASLEQLRQQLQQQQHQQQQQHLQQRQQKCYNLQQHQNNGGVQQMLTIKLPPPPPTNTRTTNNGTPLFGNGLLKSNSRNHINNNNNNNNNDNQINNNDLIKLNANHGGSTSITRKFPPANVRYAPVTSWDGSPFESTMSTSLSLATTTTTNNQNNGLKKMPPPRPPPPKVLVNNKKFNAPAPPQSVNILNNIFNRKKSTKAPVVSHKLGRLTTLAGGRGTNSSVGLNSVNISTSTTSTSQNNNNMFSTSSNLINWRTSSTFSSTSASSLSTTTIVSTSGQQQQQYEAQLISFDSPPSSPTFTQKSNSDCVSVDSFSSDSNFSSPNNGSASQPESGFEDDFSNATRSRSTTSPLDPWETVDTFGSNGSGQNYFTSANSTTIGTAPVRNLNSISTRIQNNAINSNDNPLCNGKSLLPPAPSLGKPTIIKPKISQKPKAPKPPIFTTSNNFKLPHVLETSSSSSPPPSPPMPHCPPPPPPPSSSSPNVAIPSESSGGGVTLFDVISGKADALQLERDDIYGTSQISGSPHGIALYNFDGVEDGDLNFRENDIIYLLKQVSPEWYYGRCRNGCEGILPANYIDIRVPLKASDAMESASSVTSHNGTQHFDVTPTVDHRTNSKFEFPKVKCLYNFPAEVESDLSLRENDLVTILYRINEDWLFGEIDGRQGQFPANFLEYIPANIPTP